jgi:IS5 family transposase
MKFKQVIIFPRTDLVQLKSLKPDMFVLGGNQMIISTYFDHYLFKFEHVFTDLDEQHELMILSKKIDWPTLESKLSVYYSFNHGAPALPIRLMSGLLILKTLYDLSDEMLIENWVSNPYYQAFTGATKFHSSPPCDRSLLSVFRARIGEQGCRDIFQQSVLIHGDNPEKQVGDKLILDTTCQEKYTKFPTDIDLAYNVIKYIWVIASYLCIGLRKKFKTEVKRLKKNAAFDKSNKRNENKAAILNRLRAIGLILLKELDSKIGVRIKNTEYYQTLYNNYYKALTQAKNDSNKIYSLVEPQIYCISKGKESKKYEFGTKVSVVIGFKNNVIYHIESHDNNLHDSKTIPIVTDHIKEIYGVVPKEYICDKGYRGKKSYGEIIIITPPNNISSLEAQIKLQLISKLNRRSSIEQNISHLKIDYRLGRNELHGPLGDRINPVLSATGHNFALWLRNNVAWPLKGPVVSKSILDGGKGKGRPGRSHTRTVPFDRPKSPSLFGRCVPVPMRK